MLTMKSWKSFYPACCLGRVKQETLVAVSARSTFLSTTDQPADAWEDKFIAYNITYFAYSLNCRESNSIYKLH